MSSHPPLNAEPGDELTRLRRRVAELEAHQEECRRSEAKWRSVIGHAPIFIAILDPDGTIQFLNRRPPGMTLQTAAGRSVYELTDPANRETLRLGLEHVFQQGAGSHFEAMAAGQHMTPAWYEVLLAPLRVEDRIVAATLVARDVNARKRAEEALRLERNRAQQYLDLAGTIFVVLDRQGTITLLNRKGHQVLGYAEGELLGRNWFETCVPERLRDEVQPVFRQLIAGQLEPAEYHENPVLTRSGQERIIAWHNTLLRSPAGEIVGTLSSGEDITERLRAEDALRKAHDNLDRRVRERTAELSLANQELQREVALHQATQATLRQQRESLRRLLDASDRERQLVAYEIHDGLAQHLAAARMQLDVFAHLNGQGSPEAHEAYRAAVALVDESLAEARRLIGGLRPPIVDERGIVAGIEHFISDTRNHGGFQLECDCDIGSGRLDPALENAILRIVQEAVSNAKRHGRTERARVELTQEGDHLLLEIRDWGAGFDPAKVPQGCYGLEGIRERARLLGGTATIQSAPGQGTCVRVRLPAIPKSPE